MVRSWKSGIAALWTTLALSVAAGCATQAQFARRDADDRDIIAASLVRGSTEHDPAVVPASWAGNLADDPFANQSTLTVSELTAEVLKRNPTLEAMAAAWRAAAERYPQMIALDDPMFGFMLSPATFGSNSVDFGWSVEASQKVPWPGKRSLRGAMASAEADASFHDIEDTRLKLSEAAALAFLDYFVARRDSDLNAENLRRTQDFRQTADNHLKAGRVRLHDVKDADVELGMLAQRQIDLDRQFRVAAARINTLLHRSPAHALPPPPAQLDTPGELDSADSLRRRALDHRPDLAAQAARIRQEEAAVALAAKEFFPDFEFVARYDAFWQPVERDLRPQVGLNLNLPVQRERRRAAVREAIARVERQRAEHQARVATIRLECQTAVEELAAARATLSNYDKIIRDNEDSLESVTNAYRNAGVDFLRLIESQRKLIANREKQVEALAAFHRRRAELERIIGGPIVTENHESSENPTDEPRWRPAT